MELLLDPEQPAFARAKPMILPSHQLIGKELDIWKGDDLRDSTFG